MIIEDIWHKKSVYLTSFWGWSPETWGSVGFSNEARRDTIIKETTDPFIMLVYVTKKAPNNDNDIKGKIVGFYLVSHQKGHRDEFIKSDRHNFYPEKWQYGLKAIKAYSFLPEYRLDIDEFDSTIKNRAQALSQWSEEINNQKVNALLKLPYIEVEVYQGDPIASDMVYSPINNKKKHKVRGGAPNYSGYYVNGEPIDSEKELYVLELTGNNLDTLHGKSLGEKNIYKIGLSMSPKTRLNSFNKSIPGDGFEWCLSRSTRVDGDEPYKGFRMAEFGENAMKDYLGEHGEWISGEFYAAKGEAMDVAWSLGREAARSYKQ